MTPRLRDFIDNRVFGPNHRWWALWVVVISVFIATTDVGMLTISLPVIITEFRTDITFAGWIVFVYALVTGALYLPCGRLSDLLGRKLTFSAGFLVYGVSSALAGLAHGPTQLMTCRVGQAVGAALMMTNTFALTASLFTGADRGRAMGLSGGLVSAVGFTLGPVVGGLITFTLGWRYIFFISSALSFIGFAAARCLLLDDRDAGEQKRREPFDFAGAGLFAVGLTFLLLGITRGGLGYWGFLLSAVFLGLFVWREATCPYPILDLALLRIVPFAAGNIARLSTFVALSTNELMMPFLLQLVLGMDPLESGGLMTAIALVLMVVSPSAGWLTDRIGSTPPAAAGAVVV
ncbi:MAG: MFS transporter, partial [Deltaproteobacteria bacterium]|nr:MFS transporter [Deltaproteobacteria bacterium]